MNSFFLNFLTPVNIFKENNKFCLNYMYIEKNVSWLISKAQQNSGNF